MTTITKKILWGYIRSFVDHSYRDSSSDRQRIWLGEDSIIYASKKHTTLLKHPDYNGLWLHTSIFCHPLLFRKFCFSGEKPFGDRLVRSVRLHKKSELFRRNWLRAGLGSGFSFFLEKVNPWSLKLYEMQKMPVHSFQSSWLFIITDPGSQMTRFLPRFAACCRQLRKLDFMPNTFC